MAPRFVIWLAKLDPKAAAPLTDAALKPYHAKLSRGDALNLETVRTNLHATADRFRAGVGMFQQRYVKP
jgi:hypothetical protein